MAIQFKCQGCGTTLAADAPAGTRIVCPQCKAAQRVPPQAEEASGQEATASAMVLVERVDFQHLAQKALPLALSLAMHVALLLIMAFVVWSVQEASKRERILIASAQLSNDPGGSLRPGPSDDTLQPTQDLTQTIEMDFSQANRPETEAEMLGQAWQRLAIIGSGAGGAGGPTALLSPIRSGSGPGPPSRFMGTGGNAYRVCYVIDRSGSMVLEFDLVKKELIRSIQDLEPSQEFHVIFFSAGKPVEAPPHRMVPATDYNKAKAIAFVRTMVAAGLTDPSPALRRAFSLRRKPGLIYFMTDGDFDPEVLQHLRQWNRKHMTRINTIAFLSRAGEPLLKQIAQEHGGQYVFVGPEAMTGYGSW